MAKAKKPSVNRRGFLKGAAVGAAAGATALVGNLPSSEAQAQSAPAAQGAARGGTAAAPAPTAEQIARDAGNARPPAQVRAVVRPGSDLMVQVLKDLGIEYAAANPGSIRTFKSNSPEVKNIPTLNAIVDAASKPYKP